MQPPSELHGVSPPRDLTRSVVRLLCFLLALVGAVPILLATLVSAPFVQNFAATETSRVLREQLGVSARFDVRVRLLPLRLSVENLVVPASDGGTPFLTAERASVAPRFFSLLSGKLDLGDIELDAPRGRVVVRDGKLQNLRYRLPERKDPSEPPRDAPFTVLSVSEGQFDVVIDDTRIQTSAIDLDVFAERGRTFEIALRIGESQLTRTRAALGYDLPPNAKAIDEDVLCRLDLRLRVEPETALVRRLAVLGAADLDGAAGTTPRCSEDSADAAGRLLARVSQVRVAFAKNQPLSVDGHVLVQVPLPLANRFVRMRGLHGQVGFAGDVRWDGHHKLPELRGKVSGSGIQFDVFRLAEKLEVELAIDGEKIAVPHYYMKFADGDVQLTNARIEPLAPGVPVTVERVDGKGMLFQSMMRDLGVTPNTIVQWDLGTTRVTKIHGGLSPLKIDAELFADTRNFEVFDRAYHDPAREHMIGVKAATVRARIGVRPDAFEIYDARTDFGKSSLLVRLVSIGFHNHIELDIAPDSRLDLSDITPLITITLAGKAKLGAKMSGDMSDPLLTGELAIEDFVFGGFPFGSIESAKAKFRPLWLELSDVVAKKGESRYTVPTARLDFEQNATLVTDARVQSASFDLRDFFGIWHFDEDPRFDDVKGKTALDATVRYVLGGPEDRCGGGTLRTAGRVSVVELDLFGERYDGGDAEFDFRWFDRDATYFGMELDVPSMTLRKGRGAILGSLGVSPGARVRGTLTASEVPLSKLDALPPLLKAADGRVTASAVLSGTLDELAVKARASISEVRWGRATFGPSELVVSLEPLAQPLNKVGTTKCQGPITGPFDRTAYDSDQPSGVFHTSGSLFGGQITLTDLAVTRQRKKTLSGKIGLSRFDIGAATELVPELALAEQRVVGRLTADIDIERLEMADPNAARGSAVLRELSLERAGYRVRVPATERPLRIVGRRLEVPELALELATPRGQTATFDVSATLTELGRGGQVDAKLGMRPMPLEALLSLTPRVERAEGTVSGRLSVTGALAAPKLQGGFELAKGEVALRGIATPLSDISLAVAVDGAELNVTRGSARLGAGTLAVAGGAPLHGFDLGAVQLRILGRNLSLPSSNGIRATADVDLLASVDPAPEGGERELPRVTGNVLLKTFEYRRPVTMTADITTLAQRGRRTEFEDYDPGEDTVRFDVNIRADRPLKLENNLVEAELLLDPQGLELAGTNGRYGLRGDVALKRGGRIKLRRSEFEVTEGRIRFDDMTRIAPRVDVTAVTDYRRYTTSSTATAAPTGAGATAAAGPTAQGGRFRITLHAHGDADKLKIDLSSEPALAQDDIFLLITVGLTRAELDQAQSAAVGESVALEALGTLTGADRAVTDAVPIIDELRFGSAYSSRTGRTEPTITIGKRLAERIRANVTSGVAESREIRSNVEWQLSPRVSVEGSYDNVNDISSSSLGNLGADVRWRMEFR